MLKKTKFKRILKEGSMVENGRLSLNVAFRHCFAVLPNLLLLQFPTGFAYISFFIFSRWLNDNRLQHFPHPALSQETFSSLLYL